MGSAGGANEIDMLTCANDAADMASINSANNSERMEGIIRTVLPFARSSFACPVLLCCCGLRGLRGTIHGRKRTEASVSQMVLTELSHFRMSKSVQKSSDIAGG